MCCIFHESIVFAKPAVLTLHSHTTSDSFGNDYITYADYADWPSQRNVGVGASGAEGPSGLCLCIGVTIQVQAIGVLCAIGVVWPDRYGDMDG